MRVSWNRGESNLEEANLQVLIMKLRILVEGVSSEGKYIRGYEKHVFFTKDDGSEPGVDYRMEVIWGKDRVKQIYLYPSRTSTDAAVGVIIEDNTDWYHEFDMVVSDRVLWEQKGALDEALKILMEKFGKWACKKYNEQTGKRLFSTMMEN